MSPKFRGRSEDWLDDEENAGPRSRIPKKTSHARAVELPPEDANATVIEVYPNQCRVKLDGRDQTFLCPYRRSGVHKKTEVRERTFVTVGDRVVVEVVGQDNGIVAGVCQRRNKLSRPAPGREEGSLQHVIAANLDHVLIVASARNPIFSPGLIDRFLIGTQAAGIEPLICVTKVDLLEASSAEADWKLYRDLGFPVLEVSSKTGGGLDELRARILGKAVLFCGQSGVGKTSLLRKLLGTEIGRVDEVSVATGKGKHTTTSTVLLGGPENSKWMDSPGVREFGLSEMSHSRLSSFFPEFSVLKCEQAGCTHTSESGCQAVHLARHPGYLRIYQSLLDGEN